MTHSSNQIRPQNRQNVMPILRIFLALLGVSGVVSQQCPATVQCFYKEDISATGFSVNKTGASFWLLNEKVELNSRRIKGDRTSEVNLFESLVGLARAYVATFALSTPLDFDAILSSPKIDLADAEWQKLLVLDPRSERMKIPLLHAAGMGNYIHFAVSPCVLAPLPSLGFNPRSNKLPIDVPGKPPQDSCEIENFHCGLNELDPKPDPAYSCLTLYRCFDKVLHNNNTHSCDTENKIVMHANCLQGGERHFNTCQAQCNGTCNGNGTCYDNQDCFEASCHCLGDNCNYHTNINHIDDTCQKDDGNPARDDGTSAYTWLLYGLPVACVIFICSFILYTYLRHSQGRRSGGNHQTPEEEMLFQPIVTNGNGDVSHQHPPPPNSNAIPESPINLDKIELIELLAKGRYGTVWKALYDDMAYAVKTFCSEDRASWENEKDIYAVLKPLMDRKPYILNFITAQERVGDPEDRELWIVTDYHEKGSLTDYLRQNCLSYPDLLRVISTMAEGLSFLHEDLGTTNSYHGPKKPSVAHRDFKSKNVLLRVEPDGSLAAVISDFGLAVKFHLGDAPGESHPSVGTRRYMAPEILERAISFHRDAFLRIDIYAFALVMWECVSRCSRIPGGVAPRYKLPYEEELGEHPTLDDMQAYVVDQSLRPLFGTEKDPWEKDAKFTELCLTIRDCWDCDAEARLTAGCVLTRINEIKRKEIRSGAPRGSQGLTELNHNPHNGSVRINPNGLRPINARNSMPSAVLMPPNNASLLPNPYRTVAPQSDLPGGTSRAPAIPTSAGHFCDPLEGYTAAGFNPYPAEQNPPVMNVILNRDGTFTGQVFPPN